MLRLKLRLNRNSTIVKGGLFSMFSFFNKGLNFILLIIIANFLTPEEYGSLSLFTTLIMLFGFFMCLSGEGYMSVVFFKKTFEEFRKSLTCICLIPCVMVVLSLLLLCVGSFITLELFGLKIIEVFYALTISFLTFYVNLYLDYNRIKERIIAYGIISCSFAFINFILTLLFIVLFNAGWHGRVYSLLFCTIIYAFFTVFVFLKNKLLTVSGLSITTFRTIALWGMPLIPHATSIWIRQGCDRYIINDSYTMYEVGIFSFALNLANIMNMVGMAFNSSNSIDIYKSLSNPTETLLPKLRGYTKKMIGFYTVISIGMMVVVSLFIPFALPNYSNSLIYYYLLVPYGFLQCIYYLYCNYLFYYGMNKQIMKITFSAALIHLLLSFLLTRYSLFLTALIYTVTQLIIVFSLRVMVGKALNNNVNNYKPDWLL